MDEIKELEKYKDLLDSGAITEDEFQQMKQSLLGLKTDEQKAQEAEDEEQAAAQAEREQALREIQAMREEDAAKSNGADTQGFKEPAWVAEAKRQQEQLKEQEEKERQEAQKAREEAQKQQSAKKNNAVGLAGRIIKDVILWALCVFLLLLALACFMDAAQIGFLILGIVSLVLAVMACPLISSKTRNIPSLEVYYHYKKIIATVLTVILIVLIFVVFS